MLQFMILLLAALFSPVSLYAQSYNDQLSIHGGIFPEGSIIPTDTILLQGATDGRLHLLLGIITVGPEKQGTYALTDVGAAKTVLKLPLVFSDRNVIVVESDAVPAVPEDLAGVLFNAGCGPWRKGIKKYWQFCRGHESCGGDDGSQDRWRRWCIQLVDRKRCESQNNCPSNNSTPYPVVSRVDLPLGSRLPSDELRYCCKLNCSSTHPSSCKMQCDEVPVGPCEVFTMNCPGKIGEGGCTFE